MDHSRNATREEPMPDPNDPWAEPGPPIQYNYKCYIDEDCDDDSEKCCDTDNGKECMKAEFDNNGKSLRVYANII